jgi:DNA uptake protein ComE-like DNA-binding protein
MKKLLAGLALAGAAAVVLQKTWTGAPGKASRRNGRRKSDRLAEPRAQAIAIQEPPAPERRAEPSASRVVSGARAAGQQPTPKPPDAARSAAETLNTATRQQLLSVYGIGPVLADRIIQNRPYAAAYDVVEKGIIPESIFVQLRKHLLDEHSA